MEESNPGPPNDTEGNPVLCGPWYWCQTRNGAVIGVGKFREASELSKAVVFVLGGVPMLPYGVRFERAVEPRFGEQHG